MNISDYKKSVLSWVAFFSTVCVLSVGYSAYVALLPVNAGDQLKKDDWNTMVADLSDFQAKLNPVSVSSNFVGINSATPESRLTVTHDRTWGSVNVANFVDSTYGTNVSLFWWTPWIGFNYFHNGSTAMIYKGGWYAGEVNFIPATGKMNFKIWEKQDTDKTPTTFLTQPLTITASGSVGIGTTSPLATLDVNGDFIRTIPRWQGYAVDQTDNGVLSGRTFTMTKRYASTGIKVSWSDNFRVIGNNTACSWEILFNGASCPSPGVVRFDKYEGNTSSNRHDPNTVFGTCFWLPAGTTTITTKVSQKPSHPGGDCSTGWDSALISIEGEEVR